MQPSFYIREIPIYGDLILSPMDGFSDQPFRVLCREHGSAMSYTEFTNIDAIQHDAWKALRQLRHASSEKPQFSMQIFGSDVDRFVEAALKCEALGASIVDVNMGCSVACVSSRGAGAGLLREPQKIAEIFRRVSNALHIPVTGKIRLGWDDGSLNYMEVAQAIEDNGGQAVAIHGRTKAQLYKGEARWAPIAEVKRAVKIPVIGNGDVRTVADIARIKAETGCDAVMIGRAAIGNPWIFSQLDRHEVTLDDTLALMRRHLQLMLEFYDEHGLVLFRKHAVKYLLGHPYSATLRNQLMTCERVEEFLALLDDYSQRREYYAAEAA
ncbi:MAG: tRNA dihydrouridine synthase DusB [Chloroflexi bacterium]|nr:tRNA dihydrouridine synthase DusB [Chloroflexota bacterium]